MRLLIDGVSFQANDSGSARAWRSIIPCLARRGDMEIVMLDRGGSPRLEEVETIPFPSYTINKCTAADSVLIQKMCDHLGVDVFISTGYTTPLAVPMVLVVENMVPELHSLDPEERIWMEKEIAINFAQRYVCISEGTRRDLLAIYPEISSSKTSVTLCGFDDNIFRVRGKEEIEAFKKRFGFDRPYYLLTGSRLKHHNNEKKLLFCEAVSTLADTGFDIFYVGANDDIPEAILEMLPKGVRFQRVELSDEELSFAFNGAIALVHLFSHGDYGFPLLEAMASNCPVITSSRGFSGEVADKAARLMEDLSVEEMREALLQVSDPIYRETLKQRGLHRVKDFHWKTVASTIAENILALHEDAQTGKYDVFFLNWRELREIQASVDY